MVTFSYSQSKVRIFYFDSVTVSNLGTNNVWLILNFHRVIEIPSPPTTDPTMSPTLTVTSRPSQMPSRSPSHSLVASPTPQPTVVPTAATSVVPTVLPTPQPSAVPTVPGVLDCTAGCDAVSVVSLTIAENSLLRTVRLPAYFTLSFEVGGVNLAPTAGAWRTMFDIIDVESEVRAVSVATTNTRSVRVVHNDIVIAQSANPALVASYPSSWTAITVTVRPFIVEFYTSNNVADVFQTVVDRDIITRGKLYNLFASNGDEPSSGGYIRKVKIVGKSTLQLVVCKCHVRMQVFIHQFFKCNSTVFLLLFIAVEEPHQDCTYSCSLMTGANQILYGESNQYLGSVTLSRYFSFQFSVKGMAIPTDPAVRNNIIDIVDQGGRSLFAFYIDNEAAFRLTYNGTVVSDGSFRATSDMATVWNNLAITVRPGSVRILLQGNGEDQVGISNTVDTTGQIYKIFASNALEPAALGFIYNFHIAGNGH